MCRAQMRWELHQCVQVDVGQTPMTDSGFPVLKHEGQTDIGKERHGQQCISGRIRLVHVTDSSSVYRDAVETPPMGQVDVG